MDTLDKPADYQGRREDRRLLAGAGRYTADVSLENQLHAVFLRSDHASAEILGIDTVEALSVPGVCAVITGADLRPAALRTPQPIMFFRGKNDSLLQVPERPALADGTVRFVGEPVALVLAESEAAARDAAERISVQYRPTAPVTTAQAADRAEARRVHESVPGNLALDYEYGDELAVAAAFGRAAHVVTVTLEAQRLAGNPMEPKACTIAWNPSGFFEIHSATQGMADLEKAFAFVATMPPEAFRIQPHDVGGGFGIRNEVYPEHVAILHAARALGRPIKWVGTRSETFVSDHHARAAGLTGALALDAEGRFLAIRVDWLVDLGAYCSNAGALINTAAAPRNTVSNVYDIPAAYGSHRLLFTNTTPTTAYRGAGRPNVAYLAERLVEEAARQTGIDRIALRRMNLIPRAAFPYTTPTGSIYDSGDPAGLLDAALQAADWDGFEARRAMSAAAGKLRGIGCAVFIEPSGGAGQEEIAFRFSGDTISLFTLAGPSGQGHETVFPEIVARFLHVPADRVLLHASDPAGPRLAGTGSYGSRSLISHGAALYKGAQLVVEKALRLAAEQLEVAESDVSFAAGRFQVKGTDLSIGFMELVRHHAGAGRHPLDTEFKLSTATAYPSGAHIAEVEIDPETGETVICHYVAVDDCGIVYNKVLVEGQLLGGLMQGIGQALLEECRYDTETGQLLSASFMDYAMPRADALTKATLIDRPVPSPANPLGAKGAGEAGATGSIPCLANAVLHALEPAGVRRLDMPFTPARVWEALRASRP